LLHGPAQEHGSAGVVEPSGKLLDGVNASGVDRRHVAQAQDNDRGEGLQIRRCFDQFLRRAEEKWTMNAQQRNVWGHDAPLQNMR
jgi:hypothetical protein